MSSRGLWCLALVLLLVVPGCSRRSPLAAKTVPPVNEAGAVASRPSAETGHGETVTEVDLSPVFFAYDSHTLSEEGRGVLDRIARELRSRPDLALVIEGHCDERGSPEYNLALGERRADTARDYLLASGVAARQLRVVSYGKERPFVEGHGEEFWAQNRRAHFTRR